MVVGALFFVCRLIFCRIQIIPHQLPFDPGIVFVPLAGAFWGWGGAVLCLVLNLAADQLLGAITAISIFQSIGVFFFALGTYRLGHTAFLEVSPARRSWGQVGRFILCSWVGCFVAAGWPALGFEIRRLYPFVYISSLLVMINMFFCALLGWPLLRLAGYFYVPPATSETTEQTPPAASGSKMDVLLIIGGSLGAWLIGVFVSGLFYGMSPLEPYVLGTSSGIFVPLMVIPFLIAQAMGSVGRDRFLFGRIKTRSYRLNNNAPLP